MAAATMSSCRFPCTLAGRRRTLSSRSVRINAANREQLKSAQVKCEELVKKANCAPILLDRPTLETSKAPLDISCGAWHDSGTYNKELGTGGVTGTIRFEKEMSAPPNAGLNTAYKLLNAIKKEHPDISWADLFQMGSAVAIEVAGGPKIDMLYGRTDLPADQCGDTNGLPAGNPPFPDSDGPAGHLRNVFYRMGFNDQEIVALSGAHTLGRAYKNRSGIPTVEATKYTQNGPGTKGGQSWTPEWLKFDNSYFKEIKSQMDPDLLVMQSDDVLFKDPAFAEFANRYHDDNDAFFTDYAAAHKKLSELGAVWDDEPVPI